MKQQQRTYSMSVSSNCSKVNKKKKKKKKRHAGHREWNNNNNEAAATWTVAVTAGVV